MNNNEIIQGFDDEKDESLKIRLQKIENVENCLVLYLSGYIDTYNSNLFQKRISKAIDKNFIRIHVSVPVVIIRVAYRIFIVIIVIYKRIIRCIIEEIDTGII